MLDIVPAIIRVDASGCRGCESAVVQAPSPSRPVEGGLTTAPLLAQIAVSKFAGNCHCTGRHRCWRAKTQPASRRDHLAYCLAHTRRAVFNVHKQTSDEVAAEALRRIGYIEYMSATGCGFRWELTRLL